MHEPAPAPRRRWPSPGGDPPEPIEPMAVRAHLAGRSDAGAAP